MKVTPKATTIQSSQIADGSCWSAGRFLGGECKQYERCNYRKESECKATSLAQAKIQRKIHQLERRLAGLREEAGDE